MPQISARCHRRAAGDRGRKGKLPRALAPLHCQQSQGFLSRELRQALEREPQHCTVVARQHRRGKQVPKSRCFGVNRSQPNRPQFPRLPASETRQQEPFRRRLIAARDLGCTRRQNGRAR